VFGGIFDGMIPGFNHNIRYRGVLYHIQTEDSGIENPVVTTLLYQGGTILSSKRTSYSDIVNSDKMEEVVREIMKEQHKLMLFDLKNGVFEKAEKEVVIDSKKEEVVFGDSVISEKSLDEVILDYLAAEDTDSKK
jgi:septum formation inhibitor-activating ATPase MinD